MSIAVSTSARWPSRATYCAATVFIGASGAININYGWKKGTDLASCLTWAAVAAGVACLFALSWPALIRACERRQWSVALMALCALILAGGYSVTAALGSAAGGRVAAERHETAATDAQDRAQAAYDSAKAALAKLAPSRPLAEISALVEATRCTRRVITTTARGRVTECTKPPALVAEEGRARERERLQAALDKAAADLDRAPPPAANSDAAALAKYLRAVGLDVTPDRLNDILVLLSALVIEAGGGLSLAVAMALQGPSASHQRPEAFRAPDAQDAPISPPAATLKSFRSPSEGSERQPSNVRRLNVQVAHTSIQSSNVQDAAIIQWLNARGGKALTSMKALGLAVGRSSGSAHADVRRLVAAGILNAQPGPRGTLLTLAPAARLN